MLRELIRRTPRAIAACICLSFSVPLCSSGGVAPPLPHPFNPNVLASKSYSEIYTLSALCDDQTFIQTQLIVTNIGLGDSNAGSELLVLRSGEKPCKMGRRFKKTFWKYSQAPNPSLSIGSSCMAQVRDSTLCVLALDGSLVAISFGRPPIAAKSPDTILPCDASKKFYTSEVLIPWTRLHATLRLAGTREKQMTGFGTMEHSRSVGYPRDFSRGWISFYGCRAGTRFLADFHFPSCAASGAVGWTLNGRDGTPQSMAGLQVAMRATRIGKRNCVMPWVSDPHGSFVIVGRQSLFRLSLSDDLGPFLGYVVGLVAGNPVTRFYSAQALVASGGPPIEGILEITDFE